MSDKKSLIIIDGESVKVLFGNCVKVVNFTELDSPYNKAFFDRLFSEGRVCGIESVSVLKRNDLETFVERVRSGAVLQRTVAEPQTRPERTPPAIVTEPDEPEAKASMDPNGPIWIKSNAKTTIIVDDLLTDDLVPGTEFRKAMVITPNVPIDVSRLDKERLRKSKIFRRYLENGTFSITTAAEALRMEEEYQTRLQEENDARLDQYAPILGERAEKYQDKVRTGQMSSRGPGIDAEPIEVTESGPNSEALPNEDPGSMTRLMEMMAESPPPTEEAPPEGQEQARRGSPERLAAARPQISMNPERTIKRAKPKD